MDGDARSRQPVPSPCVGVCKLDASGAVCVGCGRLIGEIAQWASSTEDRRRQIVQAASLRLLGRKGVEAAGTGS